MRGIDIRVHWSWLFIFALVAWNLQSAIVPGIAPGWSAQQRWLVGAGAALVFFLSVLAHELSHAFVALHYGMRVPSITLDRKSTRLNSSHVKRSRMPSSA